MEHEFYVLKTNIITRPQNNLRIVSSSIISEIVMRVVELFSFLLNRERERIIDLHEIFLQQCFNSVKIAL